MFRVPLWLITPGNPFPTTALLCFTVAFVALVQIPASIVIHSYSLTAGVLFNEVVIITGVPLFLIARFHFDRRRLLPFARPLFTTALLVIVLTMGADILIDYLTAASDLVFPLPEQYRTSMERILRTDTVTTVMGKFFLLCLIPAVCEEIFFRGFCQTSLTAHKGRTVGILLTAILFALLHGNPWYFHLYFFLGLLFSWLYAITGTLWIPILAHLLNNSWTFFGHVVDVTLPRHDLTHPFDITLAITGIVLTLASILALRRFGIKSAEKHEW